MGLLLAVSMIPAEALATARDEIIVLDAEENVEEVTIEDDVYESNDGLEMIEGDVDIAEPGDDSDEQTLVTDDVIEDPAIVVQNAASEQPAFENKIADVNDSTEQPLYEESPSEIASDKWQDSADYDIGDAVPYRLDAQLPDDVDAYKGYHLTFTDQMEEGLTFDEGSVKVKVGEGQGAHEVTDYDMEPEEHGFKLTVRWGEQGGKAKDDTELKNLNGKHVYVYFTATLNEAAVLGQQGNVNGAKLTYSNNVNVTSQKQD
ncbi:MAG: isopeptide-forming domain-containing fimbrial protein, partial [Atopobiaceae bacterium]|nr:isopeptide-forming domain-containing fimbrial protein [Atopobiaceae bacterium]